MSRRLCAFLIGLAIGLAAVALGVPAPALAAARVPIVLGASGTPQELQSADTLSLPAIAASKFLCTDGSSNLIACATAPGTGTVTSVSLSLPSIFNVSGSPVTTSGTLSAALANAAANVVFAGPLSGSAPPAFRALTLADLPSNVASVTGTPATADCAQFSAAAVIADSGFSCATRFQAAMSAAVALNTFGGF